MRRGTTAAAGMAGLWLSLAACASAGPTNAAGGQATSRHPGSTGGTNGTGSGGSTSGGQSSCNPNPGSCPPPGTLAPLNNCSSDQVELVANLVDYNFTNSSEPISCPILLTDLFDPSLSVATDLCGYIRYCVTPGTQISFSARVDNYVPVIFATLVPTQSTQIPDTPGIPMAKQALLSRLPMFLPNANLSDSMVIVEVQPVNPSPYPDAGPAAQACANKGAWTLWLVDSSGDTVDAGVAYLASNTLDTATNVTDSSGFAFFYNVDPTLQTVSPRGIRLRDALPDGGVVCGNPEGNPPLGFTGSVPLRGGDLSVLPYVVGPN